MGTSRAFPTVNIAWPTAVYTYCPKESSLCSSHTPPLTATMDSFPAQPTMPWNLDYDMNPVDPERFSDPKGLLALPVFLGALYGWQPAFSVFLGPMYPTFKCQSAFHGGPYWGGLDSTWMKKVTSTSYVDAEPTS